MQRINCAFRILFSILLFVLVLCYSDKAQALQLNSDIRDSVVAWIGQKPITVEEFTASYEYGPGFPKREKNSKQVHLNYLINEKLFSLEGTEKHYDTTQLFRMLHNSLLTDLSTEELYKRQILPKVKLSEEEIKDAINDRNHEIYLRWLFYTNEKEARDAYAILHERPVFDSLFNAQLSDSVMKDQRTYKTDRFKLWQRNPALAQVADTLHEGAITKPVQSPDGWYIVTIDSMFQNVLIGEGDYAKARYDVSSVLSSKKMDAYADKFIDSLMRSHKPVIDGKAYQIVRAYVGRYMLPKEIFEKWGLQAKADSAYKDLDHGQKRDPGRLRLVALRDTSFTIGDFISWFAELADYLHFNKDQKNAFSANIESTIWRMVRDKMLTVTARALGCEQSQAVAAQASWWRDKILYAMVREDMKKEIFIDKKEIPQNLLVPKTSEDMTVEINKVLFHKLLALKAKYKVVINDKLLKKVAVTDENNPRAIDAYIVKKGGIFPHPVYPTIDTYWQAWQ